MNLVPLKLLTTVTTGELYSILDAVAAELERRENPPRPAEDQAQILRERKADVVRALAPPSMEELRARAFPRPELPPEHVAVTLSVNPNHTHLDARVSNGTLIRECVTCNALIVGGPTRCIHCIRFMEDSASRSREGRPG